jgi:hypothetical protein
MPHPMAFRYLVLSAFLSMMLIGLAARPVLAEETAFYFHNIGELDVSLPQFQIGNLQVPEVEANPSSSSARIFSASPDTPTSNGTAVAMSAQIAISGQQSGYAAVVAWVTNPFPANVTIDGQVVMHVWMSSNDVLLPWQGSELFMGVGDYSPASSTAFQLLDYYLGNAAVGYNGFSNSPNEYVISSLAIDQHQFQAGSMLMFFAGAGSNKQGYTFTVYFDSPTWNSRGEVPADPNLTVPEFPNATLIILTTVILTLGGVKHATTRTNHKRAFRQVPIPA